MIGLRIVIGAIAISLCGRAEQIEMQPTIPSQQMMDEAVIETVLVDVLVSSNEETKYIRRRSHVSEELMFRNDCHDNLPVNTTGIHSANMKWERAQLADAAAARIAGENVLDRLKRKELYAPFRPKEKRISIWKEPASTQSPDQTSVRPFRVGPPGYADENRLAVVVLFFPPWKIGMHGGCATYLLRLDGNKWNVIARDVIFFV